jgi:lipid A 3-O-deacylase
MHRSRAIAGSVLFLSLTMGCAGAVAQGFRLRPDAVFGQFGHASRTGTQATTLGAVWSWGWERSLAGGLVTGYHEVSIGRWSSELNDARQSAWVSQLSITPVLRWSRSRELGGFFELGIGANVITPAYRARGRRFSTEFNFGDHLAVGYRWPVTGDEIALRLQHFSNAGIRRPNPGEDFVQVRWTRPW